MRLAGVAIVCLIIACSVPPNEWSRIEPASHLGPVTGIAVQDPGADGRATLALFPPGPCACSQAGLLEINPRSGLPLEWQHLARLDFRAFDVAVRERDCHFYLVVGGGNPGRTGVIACVDGVGSVMAQREVARDIVYAVAMHPKQEIAAVGLATGEVLLLEIPTLRTIRKVHSHTAPCRDVCFSHDGEHLASGGRDGLVLVSPVGEGPTTVLQDHTAGVECVVFANDSRQLLSGSLDGKVRIHADGQLRRTYQKLGAPVLCLSIGHGSQTNRWFAGLEDGRILELDRDRATAQERWHHETPVYSLARAGSSILVGLDDRVEVTELEQTKDEQPVSTAPTSRR